MVSYLKSLIALCCLQEEGEHVYMAYKALWWCLLISLVLICLSFLIKYLKNIFKKTMPGLSKWLDISAVSPNCILKDSKRILKRHKFAKTKRRETRKLATIFCNSETQVRNTGILKASYFAPWNSRKFQKFKRSNTSESGLRMIA